MGRLFDFHSHDGAQRVAKPSLSYKRLTEIVGEGGGDLSPHLSFNSTGGARRAGHSRSSGKTWECPVEYVFDEMSNDCPRNMVRDPVWDNNYLVWTGRQDRG